MVVHISSINDIILCTYTYQSTLWRAQTTTHDTVRTAPTMIVPDWGTRDKTRRRCGAPRLTVRILGLLCQFPESGGEAGCARGAHCRVTADTGEAVARGDLAEGWDGSRGSGHLAAEWTDHGQRRRLGARLRDPWNDSNGRAPLEAGRKWRRNDNTPGV